MKTAKLEDMTKGWFIGNFNPSLLKTNDVEVAVKSYKKVIMKDAIITKSPQSSHVLFPAGSE